MSVSPGSLFKAFKALAPPTESESAFNKNPCWFALPKSLSSPGCCDSCFQTHRSPWLWLPVSSESSKCSCWFALSLVGNSQSRRRVIGDWKSPSTELNTLLQVTSVSFLYILPDVLCIFKHVWIRIFFFVLLKKKAVVYLPYTVFLHLTLCI